MIFTFAPLWSIRSALFQSWYLFDAPSPAVVPPDITAIVDRGDYSCLEHPVKTMMLRERALIISFNRFSFFGNDGPSPNPNLSSKSLTTIFNKYRGNASHTLHCRYILTRHRWPARQSRWHRNRGCHEIPRQHSSAARRGCLSRSLRNVPIPLNGRVYSWRIHSWMERRRVSYSHPSPSLHVTVY